MRNSMVVSVGHPLLIFSLTNAQIPSIPVNESLDAFGEIESWKNEHFCQRLGTVSFFTLSFVTFPPSLQQMTSVEKTFETDFRVLLAEIRATHSPPSTYPV